MRDGESIKLFIGQVPRDHGEKELREMFEVYGEIKMLKLITDRVTGQHKGCAFLTYYNNDSAKTAQEDLHEKKTLPGARSSIQVKPAASEIKDENRKLYVGMLSRKMDIKDVTDMFSPYGTVEDVTIMKNVEGKSRGSAFIKFEARQQAQNAIRALNNSETMEGCRYPLIVKIADTDKDKQNKRYMQEQQQQQQYQQPYPQQPYPQQPYSQQPYSQQPYSQQPHSQQPQNHQQSVSNLPAAGLQSYGGANMGSAPVIAGGTTQFQQQLLAQMALPQLVTGNPNLIAASTGGTGTMSALVAMAMQQQQQQVQPQSVAGVNQQSLTSDPQSQVNSSLYNTSQLASSYALPQVSNSYGTTASGLSSLQNSLGGSLQGQLGSQLSGSLQSQLGGSLQTQLASALPTQLSNSLSSQLGVPVQSQMSVPSQQSQLGMSAAQQSQLGVTGQSQLSVPVQQSQYGTTLQGQLGSTLQGQLNTALQGQLGTSLQTQLASSLQNQLGTSSQLTAQAAAPANLSAYGVGSQVGYATVGGGVVGSTGLTDNTLQQAYSGMQQYVASYPQSYTNNIRSSGNSQQGTPRKEGPDGANLFIYQIPADFTDSDLMQTFAPFGNVVSAKVFLDRASGLSKGFGFVSYDNPSSANAAISQMNGAAIGSKRIRVQHKRPKDSGRPY